MIRNQSVVAEVEDDHLMDGTQLTSMSLAVSVQKEKCQKKNKGIEKNNSDTWAPQRARGRLLRFA